MTTTGERQPEPSASRRLIGRLTERDAVRRALEAREPLVIVGPRGCGKTTLVREALWLCGLEAEWAEAHAETSVADLFGAWLPTNDGWTWHDGPLSRAAKAGGAFVLERLDVLAAEVFDALRLPRSHRHAFQLPACAERTKAADGFVLIATASPAPELDRRLERCLQAPCRFVRMEYPSLAEERSILLHESDLDSESVDVLVRLAQGSRRLCPEARAWSTSQVVRAAGMVVTGATLAEAIDATWLGSWNDAREREDLLELLWLRGLLPAEARRLDGGCRLSLEGLRLTPGADPWSEHPVGLSDFDLDWRCSLHQRPFLERAKHDDPDGPGTWT